MRFMHTPTEKPPRLITQLTTPLASGVLVLLWLLATPAAHAAPTFEICHKPASAKRKVITVDEAGLADHIAHGDRFVEEEVCDGVDTDCDGIVDDACIACPDACQAGLRAIVDHSFEGHIIGFQECTYDENRRAGQVRFLSADIESLHEDDVFVGANLCFIGVADVDVANQIITVPQQRACAPLAANVVERITQQVCDISP